MKRVTKFSVIFTLIMLASGVVFSQEPKNQIKPAIIKPVKRNKPPSDAVILFDRGNLDKFSSTKGNTSVPWKVRGAVFTVVPGTGNILTKQKFGDIQLHVEFKNSTASQEEGRSEIGKFRNLSHG